MRITAHEIRDAPTLFMAIGATWGPKAEYRAESQSPKTLKRAHGMPYEHSVSPFAIGISETVPPASFAGKPEQSQHNHEVAHAAPPQSNKKRRSSKSKATEGIRRSVSTPHMRNLAQADTGSVSPTADKRRNKLGYHRTSVACGHCRRRKIRCQLAPDDPHGRCSQCLRLKKECNFYPVDQQAPSDRTQLSGALKLEVGSGVVSASTPSSPRGTQIPESVDEYPNYPQLSSNDPPRNYPMGLGGEGPRGMPHSNGGKSRTTTPTYNKPHSRTGPMSNPPYTYPLSVNSVGWATPDYTSETPVSEQLSTESSSSGYWNSTQSTNSSGYESAPVMAGGQLGSTTEYYRHPQEQGYGAPTRSMSYGNIEELIPQQYSNQQQEYRRPAPYSYPPLDTSAASLGGPVSGVMSAPVGAPYSNYGYQQPWSPYTPIGQRSDSASPNVFAGGQYYQGGAPLGKVEEEQPIQYGMVPSYYSNPQTSG